MEPVDGIQNIVFTYLNSVQLLYNSNKLKTQFRIILVELRIFQTEVSGLNKFGGDIERYLESFCSWQESQNHGDFSQDRTVDTRYTDHWDHGLLLTGLNLYDRYPDQDTVIGKETRDTSINFSSISYNTTLPCTGLAWVSGMCHPSYSCTINEGNNFESVFVIAHEMGHK